MDNGYKDVEIPTNKLEEIHYRVQEFERYMLALYRIAHFSMQVRCAQLKAEKTQAQDDWMESKRLARMLDTSLSAFFHPGV